MSKQLIKVEPELASGKDGTVGKDSSGSDFWKEDWPDPNRFNFRIYYDNELLVTVAGVTTS